MMMGTAFESDELYQNAGGKRPPHHDPHDPPRPRAHQCNGQGTDVTDRPPIISRILRETVEQRFWVSDHADSRTCHRIIIENLPAGSTRLYTDKWQGYRGSHPAHTTVRHVVHEWARDDDGNGHREVHCNSCEGVGATLRTYLRAFRGVHKQDLPLDVATYEGLPPTTGADSGESAPA
jgi:transposase-like protein